MDNQWICVVGASAYALQPLKTLTASLPANFPAAMLIVQHLPIDHRSFLPDLLQLNCALPVAHAIDKQPLQSGHIYVAPPNRHLVIKDGSLQLKHGPRINFVRPAIDPMFRSAAREFGSRAVGIILSGALDDGVSGLIAIQRTGGKVIVQSPAEAGMPDMPTNALRNVKVDFVSDVNGIAKVLMKVFSLNESGSSQSISDESRSIRQVIETNLTEQQRDGRKGLISTFTCPECNGTLWQIDGPGTVSFACHVGHELTAAQLLESQSVRAEQTVWTTMRLLKEVQFLANQLAETARRNGSDKDASELAAKSRYAGRQLDDYERLLMNAPDPSDR